VPLLILAVADTAAALVGVEYGKYQFTAWKGHKSLEGAVAFFVAAFFCVHVPVLLFTDTPRLESLMIALNLAMMVMMAELAAWWGLDNLIIPLFGFVLLKSFLPMEAVQLGQHMAFLLGLTLFIRYWRHRTTLADDALFGTSLWGYVVWALADWRWFLAPFLLLITYTSVSARTPADFLRSFNFPVALANIVPGLIWLLLFRATGHDTYFYPFTAAFAANLAIIALVRHKYAMPEHPWPSAVAQNAGKGLLLLIPGILSVGGLTALAALNLLSCALAVVAATLLFAWLQPALAGYPVDGARWLRQAIIVSGASAIALLPHFTLL
jgi:phytol kinase